MFAASVYQEVKNLIINSALSNLVLASSVQIVPDPKPWPTVGDTFITIHPIQRYNPVADKQYIQDRLSFGVTVGMRTRMIPNDRLAEKIFMEETLTLETLSECVISLLSTTYSSSNSNILESIERYISKYTGSIQSILLSGNRSIVDGFRYLDADVEPTPRGPEFFTSKDPVREPFDRPAGHTMTARFLSPSQGFQHNCSIA